MAKHPKGSEHRQADHPVEAIFVDRWSSRAMSGETISHDDLASLFEAARWAPSAFNEQPWRFLYATRDSSHWQTFFNLLAPANQQWCDKAGALIVIVSSKIYARNGKPNRVHEFDTGSAWGNLALQGVKMGLVIHGMAGFNAQKARVDLHVPESYDVLAMVAVGHQGDQSELPDGLRERDVPSGRRRIEETAMEGGFKQS